MMRNKRRSMNKSKTRRHSIPSKPPLTRRRRKRKKATFNFQKWFQKYWKRMLIMMLIVGITIGIVIYLNLPQKNIACYPTGKEKSIREFNQIIQQLTENKTNSLFRNQAHLFVNAGEKYRVDPALLLSIAMLETDRGTSPVLKKFNNPGGIMRTDDPSQFEEFPSLSHGIERMAWILRSYYISEKRFTPQQIGPKWAPSGAENDPNNTNPTWASQVEFFLQKFGGTTYQCFEQDEKIPEKP
jgi:hypothetical protein